MGYVTKSKTRSAAFLRVIEALKSEGRIANGALMAACGGQEEAKELIRLLSTLRLAEHSGGLLSASALLNVKPSPEQVSRVEDYLLGAEEAGTLRRIRSVMDSEPIGADEDGPLLDSCRRVVDNETVKRYAKDFLDVSDIASKQRKDKVGK